MKINEIPLEARISLEITKDDNSDSVYVNIQRAAENVIVLFPVEIDNKVLVLNDSQLKIDVYYEVSDSKPLLWRNVAYGMVNVKGKPSIVLSSKSDGVKFNRRLNFRLPLDVQGILRGQKIVVHDLSSTGISFYIPKENRKTIGTPVDIKFVANYEEYSVQGNIVREVEEDDRYLYGCSIKANTIIDTFLAEEQRRRLMRNRGR